MPASPKRALLINGEVGAAPAQRYSVRHIMCHLSGAWHKMHRPVYRDSVTIFFCHKIDDSGDANLRALVGTSAVNVGIDNNAIDMVICFEFPSDLATAF